MWLKGEENYEDWVDNITMLLGSKGLKRYIDEQHQAPADSDARKLSATEQEELDKWQTSSSTCAISIKGSIEPDSALPIKGVTDPREMLRLLKERYASKGWNLKNRYLTEYNTLRVEHFDSIGAFIDQFKVLKSKLDGLSLVLPEEAYTINFITLLDQQYPVWADRQRSAARSSANPPTLPNLIADILDESRKAEKATVLYANKPESGPRGKRRGTKGGRSGSSSDIKCTHCKKPGHQEGACWVKYPEKKPSWASKPKDSDPQSGTNSVLSVVAIPTTPAYSAGLTQKHLWCYDSGSAAHVTHTRENIDSYVLNDGSLPLIETVNGFCRPLGSGTVRLVVESPSGTTQLQLQKVLHLPSTPVNLFSGLRFESNGGYLKRGVMYDPKDQAVAQVDTTLNGHFLRVVNQPMFAMRSGIAKLQPIEVWHRRFMHLSVDNVKKTITITKGGVIQKGVAATATLDPCRACSMANSVRRVSREPQKRRTKVFDLVHVDVEKITPIGFNGDTWATLFTDDVTRARWGWSFKEKRQAYDSILRFDQLVNTQWDRTVRTYRIDGGMEFGGKKLTDHLRNGGSIAEITTPYTPEQNGVAERANRTIWSRIRAATADSNLLNTLWPELYSTAIHITNRTATSTLNEMTPAEAFKRQVEPGLQEEAYKPDVSHLRAVGCRVYVNIPKERRVQSAKLDPHAEEGILVGFEGSRIYRVYLPGRSRKVVRTSHCVFDESTPLSGQKGLSKAPLEPSEEEEEDVVFNDTPEGLDNRPNTEDAGLDQSYDPLPEDTIEVVEEEEEEAVAPPLRQRGRPKGSKNKPRVAFEPASIQLDPGVLYTPGEHERLPETPEPDEELLNHRRITRSSTATGPPNRAMHVSVHSVTLHAMKAATSDQEEPKTVREAKDSPDWLNWKEAMKTELEALVKNKTWRTVSAQSCYTQRQGRRPLSTRWVFKIKRGKDREILQYKARWVVKGYEQRYGLDYDQTFAGVTKASSWRIMFALAATYGWQVEQMDVKSAFLHGDIDEDVFVELPECWELFQDILGELNHEMILYLLKALYGLKQSPRLWQLTLKKALAKLGFNPLFADQSVYFNPKTGCFIITYVDDFLLIGPQGEAIKRLKVELSNVFDMKDLGPCTYFLGIRVSRSLFGPNNGPGNSNSSRITLCQDAYIHKVLDQFGMADSRPVSTPLDPGSTDTLVPFGGEALNGDITLYQSLIGCINYLATQTRPDVAYAASVLSRFLVNPSPAHIKAAKRVLQYLKGTVDFSITYSSAEPPTLNLRLFSDADYAGDCHTYRSTGAYVGFFAGGPATWQSKRQSVVAQSSTESEYMALSEAAKEAAWIRSLLSGLQYQGPDLNPITLFGDNQGSLALSENPTFHRGSKHIAVRYHFIRQEVEEGRLALGYIPTDQMPADGLTKALKPPLHSRFVRLLGMRPSNWNEAMEG
jgi:hypothetical protein